MTASASALAVFFATILRNFGSGRAVADKDFRVRLTDASSIKIARAGR